MKILILAMFAILGLASCGGGGGGGGNAPSVETPNPPPEPPSELQPITQAEQEQARQEVAELRADAQGNAELLRRIAQLESDIDAAQQTLAELRREIARLRADLNAQTPDPVVCTGANEVGNEPNCVCVNGYERKGGVCTKIPDPEPPVVFTECTDFRERNADGDCTYDTPEYRANYALDRMNALYAYEQGYHGQGVTIVNREVMLASHEDLDANVLTMSIDYGWKWDRFATQPTIVLTGITIRQGRTRSTEEIVVDATISVSYHGTNSGGLIAAERNGISTITLDENRGITVALGSHGVAPSAKIIPLPEPNFLGGEWDKSWHEWLAQSTVHIVNGSQRPTFASVNLTTGEFTGSGDGSPRRDIYTIFIGQDIVFLYANGNVSVDASTCCNTLLAPAVPAWYPELEPNWLAVSWSGASFDNRLAGPATPCGNRMMWCIVAPGQPVQLPAGTPNGLVYRHISTPDGPDDDSYNPLFVGSSASTPHVAGALAILKSAANHLTPQMSAITVVRLILLETATDLGDPGVDEVYGWGLVNISAGITHLRGIAGQMAAIKNSQIPRLGGAAAAANGGKFAAAAGEGAFRFWGGLENRDKWAGLATAEYGGISAFGEVGNSALEINSFLANGEVQNAESESWTAGIQRGNIWRHNDNLQISARQESRLNDGELVLQYSFGKQIRIPIKQKPTMIWTAAYSQESDNGKWTAAMEWNALTEAKGFSFAAEIDL